MNKNSSARFDTALAQGGLNNRPTLPGASSLLELARRLGVWRFFKVRTPANVRENPAEYYAWLQWVMSSPDPMRDTTQPDKERSC
jgi:hypothetical protein